MANNIKMATFQVHDGSINLPTWDYIMDEIGPPVARVNVALTRVNAALDTINNKLETWAEAPNDDNNGGV